MIIKKKTDTIFFFNLKKFWAELRGLWDLTSLHVGAKMAAGNHRLKSF